MRIFALILALYTIALTIVPCNDVHEGQHNTPMSIEAAQEHHEEDRDMCSPFCLCNCCQGFVIVTAIRHLESASFSSGVDFTLINELVHSSFSASHWQPPKIS